MNPFWLCLLLLSLMQNACAFSWHDLWVTKNQQAQAWMNAGQYDKAEETFEDPAWQAAAAFRAGHFKQAATRYHALNLQADAAYNEGNALAHKGELQPAIKAYDRALAIEPTHADALHNRKIIEALLQQDKQDKQDKQDQDKPDQDKPDQGKPDQDKPDQDKPEQDKPEQDKPEQDKPEQDKPEQDKPDQDKPKPAKKTEAEMREARERQQENEQWLRLIPDDPGGLMREKFRRDYLRKQRGWH
jgi:Ca-activated chloride channel family protein